MSDRIKSVVFLVRWVQYKCSFFDNSAQARTRSCSLFSNRAVSRLHTGCGRRLAITLHHTDVHVAVMYSCMNFAVRELRFRVEFTRESKLPGTSSEALVAFSCFTE